MDKFFHSVILDKDKCTGCTNCVKRCPTEAIRVRNGKAKIISERCIDCGECIRVCPHHAKKAKSDNLDIIKNFEYKIAIPPPSLFGQFRNLDDIDIALNGLKTLGFDKVFEVSRGAEIISAATRKFMEGQDVKKPFISSACPAIVRLIRVRFPNLCDNLLPLNSPMETTAMLAKNEASKETGLDIDKIGAFFISPCPAKVTEIKAPIVLDKSYLDGAIAISHIFPQLVSNMKGLKNIEPISESGIIGVSWAATEGESAALLKENYLAADGIENSIRVLEELEDEKIKGIDFVELNACSGGCVGGVLNVENAYVAKARIHILRKYLPVSRNHLSDEIPEEFFWEKKLLFAPVLKLSNSMEEAMEMMVSIDKICSELPGLDCGSCGAPSCRAMAEDIVKGFSSKSNCFFILKDKMDLISKALEDAT